MSSSGTPDIPITAYHCIAKVLNMENDPHNEVRDDPKLPKAPPRLPVEFCQALSSEKHLYPPAWNILAAVTLHSTSLHRFTDQRQVSWKGRLRHDVACNWMEKIPRLKPLHRMYLWNVAWIKALHLDAFVQLQDSTTGEEWDGRLGVQVVHAFDARLRGLSDEMDSMVEANMRLTHTVNGTFLHRPELEWVATWRAEMLLTLNKMEGAKERFWYDEGRARHEMTVSFAELSPPTRILMELHHASMRFENTLLDTHVEDEYMLKRLFVLRDREARNLGFGWVQQCNDHFAPQLVRCCRRIQAFARVHFDYRRWRDWEGARPWRKLFLLYDHALKPGFAFTSDFQGGNASQGITQVRKWFNESGQLGKDLFDCWPKYLSELGDNKMCPICWQDYKAGEVVVETHCNHYFHSMCLVSSWAHEYHSDNHCPLCKHGPHRLRDRFEPPRPSLSGDSEGDDGEYGDDEDEDLDLENEYYGDDFEGLESEAGSLAYREFWENAVRKADESIARSGMNANMPLYLRLAKVTDIRKKAMRKMTGPPREAIIWDRSDGSNMRVASTSTMDVLSPLIFFVLVVLSILLRVINGV